VWKLTDDQLVVDWYYDLVVDSNKILRFAGFVDNDLCGSVRIFGHLLFRGFPIVNPIKKACCNFVRANG
jgi:hypothetical protein